MAGTITERGVKGFTRKGLAIMDPSAWAELRAAYEAGVTDHELERDFGVQRSTIRKRRSMDRQAGDPWLSPAQLKLKAEQAKLQRRFDRTSNATPTTTPITAEESIAQKLMRDGELSSVHAMKVLLKKLTVAAMDPDSIADLEDVGDVATAVKAARNIAGLDRPEVALQVNVGNMFPSE